MSGCLNSAGKRLISSSAVALASGQMENPSHPGWRTHVRAVASLNVGLLNMQTEEVSSVVAANNFSVARLRKDLPNRSAVGIMATNRLNTSTITLEDPDEELPANDNQAVAVDARLGIGEYLNVSGFFARTFSPVPAERSMPTI